MGSSSLRHAWYEKSKAAYALRALPEDERLAFEAHLADYPELREEVERLISLTHLLALACEEHDPPPHLRNELLSQIEDGVPQSSAKERLRSLLRRVLSRRLLAAAAAVLLIALLVRHLSMRARSRA